jgi:hypothetical protein
MNTPNSPVFISFLYRSGSTLLVLALDQSAELAVSYDTIHFMRFSYGKYRPVEKNFERILRDTDKRIWEKWQFRLNLQEIQSRITAHGRITEGVVYDEIMRSFLGLNENGRWLDRSDVCWEGIPGFLEMFPEGRVIHLYRDPRAVVSSYKHMTYHPEPMYLDAVFASLAMFNYISREEIRNHPCIYLLKYEELVSSPEKVLIDLCAFLGIRFTDKMLEVGNFIDRFGKKFDSNSSFTGPRSNFDTRTIDLWKNKLSKVEIRFTEMILKGKMESFGYQPDNPLLNDQEAGELSGLLDHEFIRPRYNYWLAHGDGQQAFPNAPGAYLDQ